MKRKPKPDLDTALEHLISLVDIGVEYPDAHHDVIKYYRLTVREGETLTQVYDEYCEEEK